MIKEILLQLKSTNNLSSLVKNKAIAFLGIGFMLTLFVMDFLTTDALKSNLFTSVAIFLGLIIFKLTSKK